MARFRARSLSKDIGRDTAVDWFFAAMAATLVGFLLGASLILAVF
ncbi:MAG: hypothetical protein ACXWKB_08475 [Methyloceanibacter sp.]